MKLLQHRFVSLLIFFHFCFSWNPYDWQKWQIQSPLDSYRGLLLGIPSGRLNDQLSHTKMGRVYMTQYTKSSPHYLWYPNANANAMWRVAVLKCLGRKGTNRVHIQPRCKDVFFFQYVLSIVNWIHQHRIVRYGIESTHKIHMVNFCACKF